MISFQSEGISFKLSKSARLRTWLKDEIKHEGKSAGDIVYRFTNDETVLEHNIRFLDHKTLTDIITFDYSHGDIVSGDILISIERVRENAVKFRVTFEEELHRVMIHGVLHLCGFKDKNEKQRAQMRKREDAALARLTH